MASPVARPDDRSDGRRKCIAFFETIKNQLLTKKSFHLWNMREQRTRLPKVTHLKKTRPDGDRQTGLLRLYTNDKYLFCMVWYHDIITITSATIMMGTIEW